MKICLVGGIFDCPEAICSKRFVTPETVLLEGFRKIGVDVRPIGHAGFQPSDDFDVIHVHHFGRAAVKMASSKCRGRFVFTGHNGLIVTSWKRSWLRRYAFQYVIDKAEAVVALSNAEANYFASVIPAEKVYTIPNGIPADVFRLSQLTKHCTKFPYDILYVGQLIDWKGVNFLLEAIAIIRNRLNVHLRLVYHNDQLETDFRRQANDLGIADHVDFVGNCGQSELAEEYHKADLLVLPSFADCLPSVVTEALLCGTPVVAGGVCGVPEQIGPYGLTVPPGDATALATAIESVLINRQRYQALAGEMRAYAKNKYSPEAMVAGHLALYRDLLAREKFPSKKRAAFDFLVRGAAKMYWQDSPAAS